MSKPTDTAQFFEDLNGGTFISQIGHALSEVAAAVVDHGKAGKLVITLDFTQISESSQVKINHKLDYKVPTKRGTRADEPRRVAKIRNRKCTTESKWATMVMPLADASVGAQDVTDFWTGQPFDLMLPTINGKRLRSDRPSYQQMLEHSDTKLDKFTNQGEAIASL